MEANYLRNSVGPVLSSAFGALYTYGINTSNDPTHPHKDPIGFVARYLLEHTKVQNEIIASQIDKNRLINLHSELEEQGKHFKILKDEVTIELLKYVENRAMEIEKKKKMEEDADLKAKLEAEVVTVAVDEDQQDVVLASNIVPQKVEDVHDVADLEESEIEKVEGIETAPIEAEQIPKEEEDEE